MAECKRLFEANKTETSGVLSFESSNNLNDSTQANKQWNQQQQLKLS